MSESPTPADIVPDDKDWTWTLTRQCPDCGFTAAAVPGGDIAAWVMAATEPWSSVLARPDVTQRPRPQVWSPLEYGCHVRDVCRLFDQRLHLMLDQEEPTFANWDQDVTAVEDDYGSQDPAVVAEELAAAGAAYARSYAAVRADQWDRSGLRSNGSRFTVLTLGQYGLHDLVHHVWDVQAPLTAPV